MSVRHLCLILGDQLDRDSSLFRRFDPRQDRLWMAEVHEESTHVWSHKQRIALFLAAMRHFAEELTERGWPIDYQRLGKYNEPDLGAALAGAIRHWQPERLRLVRPGDYRVLAQIRETCADHGTPLDILNDDHFLASLGAFREWSANRKQPRLEYWYRLLRQRHQVLLEPDGQPVGGRWNFDAKNRGSFPKSGPDGLPPAPEYAARKAKQERLAIQQQARSFRQQLGR